jgi:hypothetical protein
MGVNPGLRVMALVAMAGCGFHPDGGGGGGEDAPEAADAPAGDPDGADVDAPDIDAPDIDAPDIDAPDIDAPDIDARPMCPVGYNVLRPSGRYKFVPIAQQHALADLDCNDDLPGRTHLASFEVAGAFNADIGAINPGNSAIVYIGGVCGAVADCALMASWSWNTGGLIDASLWEANQPNNGATQKALVTERPMGTWVINNTEATQTRPYICECDP